ncbi:unnamed protein product [Arctia plantaginis]|uniref:Uncharacterized protein n=1 Tax=Arctia plantaginis TaxID=874455 RepID=A0A8S1AIK9_ARCPL|nr:unnamed protein product [Arctia plantaginis]
MAELIDMQAIIYDSIVKLGINIKKDSVERKTLDYFKRRLNTLEEYWTEYEGNHDRITGEVSQTNSYFVNREREKTMKAYEEVKALINQQYQKFLHKTANPIEQGKTPYKAAWDAPQPGEEEATAVVEPSSQTLILKTSTGTNIKAHCLN